MCTNVLYVLEFFARDVIRNKKRAAAVIVVLLPPMFSCIFVFVFTPRDQLDNSGSICGYVTVAYITIGYNRFVVLFQCIFVVLISALTAI